MLLGVGRRALELRGACKAGAGTGVQEFRVPGQADRPGSLPPQPRRVKGSSSSGAVTPSHASAPSLSPHTYYCYNVESYLYGSNSI